MKQGRDASKLQPYMDHKSQSTSLSEQSRYYKSKYDVAPSMGMVPFLQNKYAGDRKDQRVIKNRTKML